MATVRCFIFKDLDKKPFDLDTAATLDRIRNVLSTGGWMTPTYRFVYYNKTTKRNDVLSDTSVESSIPLGDILDSFNQCTITNVNARKPDLIGTITNWFTDRKLQATVGLNGEQNAQEKNRGKFAPFLLRNVRSTNPDRPVNFTNAVICERGSVINFVISSWGAAGYGFSIKSGSTTFVNTLYSTNNGNYGTITNVGLNRYQDAKQMIQVDSNADQSIPFIDNVKYSEVRIRSWNMSSYKQSGKTYSSNLHPQLLKSSGINDPGGFKLNSSGATVPGDGVESGSPHAGGASQTDFGAGISDIRQDDPNGTNPLGEIILYFLVFKDHETAKQVIQQQNAQNPY
jgi:hypothetical protein